jgi:acyl-CoA dehydrogenase
VQEALDGVRANFEAPLAGAWLRLVTRPLARWNALGTPPSDRLGAEAAATLTAPGERRDRLTAAVYVSGDADDAVGRIEHAFQLAARAQPAEQAVARAMKARTIPRGRTDEMVDAALAANVIDEAGARALRDAAAARRRATAVDDFSAAGFARRDDFLSHPDSPQREEPTTPCVDATR